MASGRPIAIVYQNSHTKKFELDAAALNSILLSERARNCEISIVSVAGAFRKGKSFLLSFFLRYLEVSTKQNNASNWLGDPDAPLSGFSWKGGSERHTTGILIWSEIFYYTINGKEVGVILMDTQGTFDNNSTMKDNVTIFAFSTMLSSIQIYNLFHNIQEDDLQHLQLFTEYGKLALEHSSGKPFQQLLFLVRDWNYPYEYSYGEAGGQQLLRKALELKPNQPEELRSLRMHIESCYEKLSSFLMPYPGKAAAMSRNFTGKVRDLDDDFADSLKELVPLLLSKHNLVVKRFNGQNLKAKELLNYIDSYWKIFQDGNTPTPKSIFDATAEATCMAAVEAAKEYYGDNMDKAISDDGEAVDFTVVAKTHEQHYQESLKIFREKAVLGDERLKLGFLTKLMTYLQKAQVLYMAKNDAKKSKDLSKTIDNLSGEIDKYKASNEKSTESMKALENQLAEYRAASDAEKEKLRLQIVQLEQSRYAVQGGGGGGGDRPKWYERVLGGIAGLAPLAGAISGGGCILQ